MKDGNASSLVIGVILLLVGLYLSYHYYATSGFSNIIWVPVVVFVFGLVLILVSGSITVQINRSQISFAKKSILAGKSAAYATQDAVRVELRKEYHMQQSTPAEKGAMSVPQEVLTSQSVIVFKDGTEVPLENAKSSGQSVAGVLMSGQGKELSIANQVATFLGIPLQEILAGPSPMVVGMPPVRL